MTTFRCLSFFAQHEPLCWLRRMAAKLRGEGHSERASNCSLQACCLQTCHPLPQVITKSSISTKPPRFAHHIRRMGETFKGGTIVFNSLGDSIKQTRAACKYANQMPPRLVVATAATLSAHKKGALRHGCSRPAKKICTQGSLAKFQSGHKWNLLDAKHS